jgi:hypothetical protein
LRIRRVAITDGGGIARLLRGLTRVAGVPVNSCACDCAHSAGVGDLAFASFGYLRGITATILLLIGSITRTSLAVLA